MPRFTFARPARAGASGSLTAGSLTLAALALGSVALAGCETTVDSNPNAITEEQALRNQEGLLGLVVGTRRAYATSPLGCLYNAAVADGLTTRGLYVINTGNGDLAAIEAGGQTLGPANAIASNLFAGCTFVLKDAGLLIDNAKNIADPVTQASVQVHGHLFKALAIGTLAAFYEQVPTSTVTAAGYLSGERVTFTPRVAALTQAVTLLRDARTLLDANGGVTSVAFNARAGTAIDTKNTLTALIARYSLMAGDLDGALAAALAVDLTKRSTFTFDAQNPNPLFRSGLVSANVVGGAVGFGLPAAIAPEAGDGRTAFYLGNANAAIRVTGFFKNDADPIPVYLPGEMLLIQAEVHARQNRLADAVTAINRVRTKTVAQDVFGVGANLPAYSGPVTQGALLAEIFRQRALELYLQGLRLEDGRRLGRPAPGAAGAERTRNFYPYPQVERDNNASTPADPAG